MYQQKYSHILNHGVNISIPRQGTTYTGKAIIGRIGRSFSDYSVHNKRMIVALLESGLTTGDLVQAGLEMFLCVVSKKQVVYGQEICIVGHGLLCNSAITVTRESPVYDSQGNLLGTSTVTIISNIPCHTQVVTAGMKLKDPGYNPSTVLEVTAQNNSAVALLDKATIAGNVYRIDDIDRFKIPGCMCLQLSVWAGG